MLRQPAYVNLIGCWLLTLMLTIGKLLGLAEMNWWWVVAPIVIMNAIFATITIIRGFLVTGVQHEDQDYRT